MGYGDGTIAAIKGHETRHCTNTWAGERFSIINVNQSFPRRKYVEKLLQEQGMESLGAEEVEILNAKDEEAKTLMRIQRMMMMKLRKMRKKASRVIVRAAIPRNSQESGFNATI